LAANSRADDKVTLKDRWEAIKGYFRGTYFELKKVHWPDRRQLVIYTGVVLFTVVTIALLIWLLDSGLGKAMELLFNVFGK
jgi:preprotein translocase subunit SecE